MRVGVLSDTHGLLRPEVLRQLQGVGHILHAGDVGDPAILTRLAALAPVTAIRGNIDRSGPCAQLPPTEMVELGGHWVYLVHDLHDLDLRPEAASISVVLSGHSHKPGQHTTDGVLYLNPGSVGPRRFSIPVSMAILHLSPGQPPLAELITLNA